MNALVFLVLSMLVFLVVRMRTVFLFLFILTLVFLIRSGVFIVYEGSQVVITQFGRIVGQPYKQAGLYFKIPFLWKANYFDKRIFTDTDFQAEVATRDQYFISIDTAVTWRITDPVTLFTVMDSSNEEVRVLLRNIVSGSVREVVSKYNLIETVSNISTNLPSQTLLVNYKSDPAKVDGKPEPVFYGRAKLVTEMKEAVANYMRQFGIEVIQVLITDIRYSKKVEERIYERMSQQRLRIAARLRSTGMKYYHQIIGEMNKDYKSIIAPAEKQALLIRGEAEAKATEIYADAYGQSASFYNFWRTLQAYGMSIPAMSQGAFLSTDSQFLELLNNRKQFEQRQQSKQPSKPRQEKKAQAPNSSR